jgi:hypothetical protein
VRRRITRHFWYCSSLDLFHLVDRLIAQRLLNRDVRHRSRAVPAKTALHVMPSPTHERAAVDDAVALLPVPRQAFGEHFHLAPSILRLHENRQRCFAALSLKDRGLRLDHIPAVVSPALRFQVRGELRADVLHVGPALEENVLNHRLVLDVSRIFRQREILHVEFRNRRLSRGFILRLIRGRLVARSRTGSLFFLLGLLRLGGLKLFRDLSQWSHELDLHLPRLAKRLNLPVGGEFTFHLAILECEVVRVNRANRAEALLLVRAVNHLAAKDFTIIMDRDDQRAAEPAERSAEVGLLIFGMILFRKHEVHAGFITEWLAPMG